MFFLIASFINTLNRRAKIQRTPLGNHDCSVEGGASGRVDICRSKWILQRRVQQSVTLLGVELEVLHDLAEGLLILDDPGHGKQSSNFSFQPTDWLPSEQLTWGDLAALTPAWSPESSPDSRPPQGGPGHAAEPAAAWPSVREERCEDVYSNIGARTGSTNSQKVSDKCSKGWSGV